MSVTPFNGVAKDKEGCKPDERVIVPYADSAYRQAANTEVLCDTS